MPACTDNGSIFLRGHLILLPPPLCFFFLCLSFVKRFLFSHTGFHLPLFDFLLIKMDHSWACRWSLIINQLSWTPLRFRAVFNGILPRRSLSAPVCSPEVQDHDAVVCFIPFSHNPEIYHLMMRASKAAVLHKEVLVHYDAGKKGIQTLYHLKCYLLELILWGGNRTDNLVSFRR